MNKESISDKIIKDINDSLMGINKKSMLIESFIIEIPRFLYLIFGLILGVLL